MAALPIRSLALIVRTLEGGGMQRIVLLLAEAFAKSGIQVEVVTGHGVGATFKLPPGVSIRCLPHSNALTSSLALLKARPHDALQLLPLLTPLKPDIFWRLPAFIEYLRTAKPDAILAAGTQSNLAAIIARAAAGIPARLVVSEHNTLSVVAHHGHGLFRRAYPGLIRRFYPEADAIAAVSRGVARDLAQTAHLPEELITLVYNPVDAEAVARAGQMPVEHPWLTDRSRPLILGVGRLHRQKDFPTLIRAFAIARKERDLRLVIVGEGSERKVLDTLCHQLGVQGDVLMPGFVDNPFAWMSHASLFVLSSAWEGFALVLLEALASSCPVISTDCPNGPREILQDDTYGALVPIGNPEAMADAMLATLAAPPDAARLRARAAEFSVDATVAGYRRLLEGVGRHG
ncbi:glycosyltransferase [Nitrosomonas sp. Nm33]|uniref:glycosyltransferase n=1 Tax=Nitrosomonas sp. Nm33 TaxID=133724 RepID=UPI0008977F81|nr:glycosyltransferase [Nitrosomonas sp. Nm33]SDY19656.1 Glycosyltransferase involved in cell wall bisynthesis [Nitrosomonas sp. Nm33]